jgi:proline dehydrogenase
MIRQSLLYLSESSLARRFVTRAPGARSMARRFVAGETVTDAIRAARAANEAGLLVTLDYLGESVNSREEARGAADVYLALLEHIAADRLDANISLKMTQMGQDIDEEFLRENLGRILDRARELDVFVRLDMESSAYTERTLAFFERLWQEGYRGVGTVLQSYLYRTEADVRRMNELGARVRLCKGAYLEPPSVAFQDKRDVDANFVRCARLLLEGGVYPGIATHDGALVDATRALAAAQNIAAARYEFQMLYGVRRELQQELIRAGYNMRVYIPFGEAWYPYLMRRMAERPANMMLIVNTMVRDSALGRMLGNGRRSG